MATLATVYSRMFTKETARCAAGAHRAARAVPVRAFANEDIYFFVKRIDNSRVVRQTDPQARRSVLEDDRVGGRGRAAADRRAAAQRLRVAGGLPDSVAAQEGQRLAAEQASLELREAQLLSPARMEDWRASSSSSIRSRRRWCIWIRRMARRWR